MAVGILAALRTRDADGHGQLIEVSLQQIGYYINGNDAATTLVTGESPPRHDRREPRNPLWNHYECKDGRWLSLVMINSAAYWPGFTRAIGHHELEKKWMCGRENQCFFWQHLPVDVVVLRYMD